MCMLSNYADPCHHDDADDHRGRNDARDLAPDGQETHARHVAFHHSGVGGTPRHACLYRVHVEQSFIKRNNIFFCRAGLFQQT